MSFDFCRLAGMITKTTESAFRILIALGTQEVKKVTPLADLHERVGGSQTYLAKITAALTRARIVRSNRGAQGGLLLAREPSEIKLLEIVAAIQGIPAGSFCSTSGTVRVDVCGYHQVMEELHNSILKILESRTLADLIQKPCGKSGDHNHANCLMKLG